MPPHSTSLGDNQKPLESKQTGVLFEADADTADGALAVDVEQLKRAENRELILVWPNIFWYLFFHLSALYGGYLFFFKAKWATVAFSIFLYSAGVLGITAGVHRLWTHRAYKAKWPLRLILIIFNTIAYQDDVYHWSRDHRVHHKFSDTDSDPHNATRGFFFCHVGWLLCKKQPDVKAQGKLLDLSDLEADPFVMFQRKYYKMLMPLFCFILPTGIPMYFWNETLLNSWFVATMFRWCFLLNVTWCVNSVAHMFGNRPYDKSLNPVQNPGVALFSFGEGWHNYHHVFPWDYKTAEWGNYSLNLTTAFIDFFAKIGWAYDLKSVAPETIKKRVKRTGDGSHGLWGYGDKDISPEDQKSILTLNQKEE